MEKSNRLIAFMKRAEEDNDIAISEVGEILKEHFEEIREWIWEDALREYDLVWWYGAGPPLNTVFL